MCPLLKSKIHDFIKVNMIIFSYILSTSTISPVQSYKYLYNCSISKLSAIFFQVLKLLCDKEAILK